MTLNPGPVVVRDSKGSLDPLWRSYKKSRDIQLRDQLVESYAHLVRYAVERVGAILPRPVYHDRRDDMISAGFVGLMDAVDKFKPALGIKFETYGSRRIHGSVLDELRRFDWAPRRLRRRGREIEHAFRQVEARTGHSAETHEVAEFLGTTTEVLSHELDEIRTCSVGSLDSFVVTARDGSAIARLDSVVADSSTPLPDKHLEEEEKINNLAKLIADLPEVEAKVLAFYYQEGLTLKEIGSLLGVSESRISQIRTQAVLRLRGRVNHEEERES